jgi:hypothetical protein
MITFTIPIETKIPDLPEMIAKVQQHGGSIVQYQHVFSIILYMQRSPVFRYVPPGKSHKAAGIPHAVFCGLLGWWSVLGWLVTPPLVVMNLLGGIDMTKILIPGPPPLPGELPDTSAHAELQRAEKRQQYIVLGYLGLLLLAVGIMLLNYYRN